MIDDSQYPLRYTFTHKGAFFMSLDDTTIGLLDSEQYAWVEDQLQQAQGYAVKIVYGHVPIHPVTQGRETEVLGDFELEALFASHGVTAFVSGHHHGYYPGAAGGVRQLAMPCLGAGSRKLIGTGVTSPRGLAMIEIENDAVTSLEAYDISDFGAPLPRSTLPETLEYGSHVLTRDDLAGF
jgi:hypothetical protein